MPVSNAEENSIEPPATPESPVLNLPADNLDSSAGDIAATLEKNQAVSARTSGGAKPKPDRSGWQGEPVSNFKLNDDGSVKLRANGKPVRRGGKPAKPKAGDRLADGTVYGAGKDAPPSPSADAGASRVVLPGQDAPGGGGGLEGGTQPGMNTVEAGPEAGRILSKLGFSFAKRAGGPRWEPTDDERELIDKAAAATLNGRRMPWWLVLFVGVSVYVVSRVEFKAKPKENKANNGKPDAHSDRGPDAIGKDVVSEDAGPPVVPTW